MDVREPAIADNVLLLSHSPSATTFTRAQKSVITRFRRWLKHDTNTLDDWFLRASALAAHTLISRSNMLHN